MWKWGRYLEFEDVLQRTSFFEIFDEIKDWVVFSPKDVVNVLKLFKNRLFKPNPNNFSLYWKGYLTLLSDPDKKFLTHD